jgi:hypothetical protein
MKRYVAFAALLATVPACAPRGASRSPDAAALSPGAGGMRWLGADTLRAQALGAGPPTVIVVGAGAAGDNLGGRVQLPRDACGIFMARGTSTIDDLDLFVYGDDGAVLGDDETSTATPNVVVCPPHPEYAYGFGRVAAGHGLFAVSAQVVKPADAVRIAKALGSAGKPEDGVVADGGWPGLDEALARHQAQLGGDFREVRRVAVPLDPRVPTRLSATVEAHGCVDLLVVPAEEVADVEVAVLDDHGRILGRSPTDDSTPAAVVCAEDRVDVVF